MPNENDRRCHPRIPFYETVLIKRQDGTISFAGKSFDLSIQGIGVRDEKPLWPGESCQIEFNLLTDNGMRQIKIGCESMNCQYNEYSRGYRIGLEFREIGMEDARFIEAHIRQKLAD